MKKLFEQIVKFGFVGVIAFVIDEGVMNLLLLVHLHNVVASTISFLVSLVFNYWASMKYVFVHRNDMARWMEALIFLVSSVIGLGINELIIWASTLGMGPGAMISQHGMYTLRTNIGKLIATVVVAVWNFIIRKWLLDATSSANAGVAGVGAASAKTGMAAAKRTTDSAGFAQGAAHVSDDGASGVPQATDGTAEPVSSAGENAFSHKLGIWSIEHTPKGWK